MLTVGIDIAIPSFPFAFLFLIVVTVFSVFVCGLAAVPLLLASALESVPLLTRDVVLPISHVARAHETTWSCHCGLGCHSVESVLSVGLAIFCRRLQARYRVVAVSRHELAVAELVGRWV